MKLVTSTWCFFFVYHISMICHLRFQIQCETCYMKEWTLVIWWDNLFQDAYTGTLFLSYLPLLEVYGFRNLSQITYKFIQIIWNCCWIGIVLEISVLEYECLEKYSIKNIPWSLKRFGNDGFRKFGRSCTRLRAFYSTVARDVALFRKCFEKTVLRKTLHETGVGLLAHIWTYI